MKLSGTFGRPGRAHARAAVYFALAVAVGGVLAGAALAASGAASAVPPANTAAPSLTGALQQGQVLTGAPGSWTGDQPITFAYQWQRCSSTGDACGNIASATAQTYTAVAADVGGTLRLLVTASNTGGVSSALSIPAGPIAGPGSAPTATAQPNPSGTPLVGGTVSVDDGSWSGTTPLTFTYQWQRCTAAGTGCGDIAGATAKTYATTAADAGARLRALVTAKNGVGTATIASNLTGTIGTVPPPVNTARPSIPNGTAVSVGQRLAAGTGGWTGAQPITFAYSWSRCPVGSTTCTPIAGATGSSYAVVGADVGLRLQLTVRATNPGGSTNASSDPSATVQQSSLPAGAIRLDDGRISIPVTSVSLPARLVISKVSFTPNPLRRGQMLTGRFRITDTRGYVVRDALVLALPVPSSQFRRSPETPTGVDGFATISFQPTAQLPFGRSSTAVFFVRARKNGENLLSGVSIRRLVQVRTAAG